MFRHRIAIVDADRCKPKKCGKECKKFCPVVHTNKPCIEVRAHTQHGNHCIPAHSLKYHLLKMHISCRIL
eukprot:2830642-Amphidinium_carterae.1